MEYRHDILLPEKKNHDLIYVKQCMRRESKRSI